MHIVHPNLDEADHVLGLITENSMSKQKMLPL